MQPGLPVTPLMMAATLLQLPVAATPEPGRLPAPPVEFGDELAKLLSDVQPQTGATTTPPTPAPPASQPEDQMQTSTEAAVVLPAALVGIPLTATPPAPQEVNATRPSRETPTLRRTTPAHAAPVDIPTEQPAAPINLPPTQNAPPLDLPPPVVPTANADQPQEHATPASPLPSVRAEPAKAISDVNPPLVSPAVAKETEPKPTLNNAAPPPTAQDSPTTAPAQPMHTTAPEAIASPPPTLPVEPARRLSPATETPATAAPTPPPPPHAASPVAQLAPAIMRMAHAPDGSPRLTVRLDPPELGHVQIRIDRPPEAPARVEVIVEKAETLTLLLRDQPQLQRALDQAGVPSEGRNVTFHIASPDPTPRNEAVVTATSNVAAGGLSGDGSHSAQRQGGQQPQQQSQPEDTEDAGFVPTALPGWMRGGLDITA